MGYDPQKHGRRSIRLKGYDYSSAGAYFVTICTKNRDCLFGEIENGEMQLNDFGRIVVDQWLALADVDDAIMLDEWVVMPNHIHGIVVFTKDIGDGTDDPFDPLHRRRMVLPKLVGRFKMRSAKLINLLRGTPGVPLWHRNYYEHIIRNEAALGRIHTYIATNPQRWAEDEENPRRRRGDS